jgi:hypothetical protein
MSAADIDRYDPWLPELYREDVELPPLPVAVYPAYTAPRISTQRSCFTVHGEQISAFQQLLLEQDACLRKIVIAKSATGTIRKELLTCGIDEVTIYPDLDGLGRYLASALRIETGENDPARVTNRA